MPGRSPEWCDAFLTALVNRLSVDLSTAENPRCLSRHTLNRLLNSLESDTFRLRFSHRAIYEWLLHIGLLAPIPVEYGGTKPTLRTTFFRLDISTRRDENLSPLELLQAYDAEGVICYFSAIAFHSLSSQPPVHHHIGIPSSATREQRPPTPRKSASSTPRESNPLGTRLFNYAGLPYYRTSREARLVPGVQLRYAGPSSVIRMTTLEQTLLDTLHRPLSCGGPAVVFEAWERGLSKVNEDRISDYLLAMEHPPAVQRLGYMLADLDHKPGARLSGVIEGYLSRLDPADQSAYQQLFAGMKYRNLKTPWLVYGP